VNFFKLYIGDYQRDTGALTLAEHGAYLLMLQYFYATEQPLPVGRDLHRLLRAESKAEREAIDRVAERFWRATDAGLVNDRALQEIEKGARLRDVSREVGMRGGRPNKTQQASGTSPPRNPEKTRRVSKKEPNGNPAGFEKEPNGNPNGSKTETQDEPRENPNQTPDTRHHSVPIGTDAAGVEKPPDDLTRDELWAAGKSLLAQAGMPPAQCGSFVGKLVKDYGHAVVVDAVRAAVVARPADPVGYLKATCMHAAGQRQTKPPGKHSGFEKLDYREGVSADGMLA